MVCLGAATLLAALKNLQGYKWRTFFTIPRPSHVARFFTFAGPIAFALLGKTICYSALTWAAGLCGSVPLAAHQVLLRVFWFYTTFGDALVRPGPRG